MQPFSFLAILCLHLWAGSEPAQDEAISITVPQPVPKLDIWYGSTQYFGQVGQAQAWINVLGNVKNSQEIATLSYTLNGAKPVGLTMGSDLHRLACEGDFNVELTWDEVQVGRNQLLITAKPHTGPDLSQEVTLVVEKGNIWPLPYRVDFSAIEGIQGAVQVVDGYWRLEEGGIRTVQPYYDRVLSVGDTTWTNYETTVKLTINGFTPSTPGPPTYNVTHFGVAMRWRGHHRDGRQPSRKWYPLGAQGEFLLQENLDSCQWRILRDGQMKIKPPIYADRWNPLALGQAIYIKTQIVTLADASSRYRFKQWKVGESEPLPWDVEGLETGDYPSGALCLVPHNSDVTIHELRVEPIGTPFLSK